MVYIALNCDDDIEREKWPNLMLICWIVLLIFTNFSVAGVRNSFLSEAADKSQFCKIFVKFLCNLSNFKSNIL